jgi:hypothetical protein
VSALPKPMNRASELQKLLEIDYKLCWRIFKVIRAEDPLTGMNHVPTLRSLRLVVEAAERAGAPLPLLKVLEQSVGRLHEVVQAHAGDRGSFESMVSIAAGGNDASQADQMHRRNAHRSLSHLWGVQSDTAVQLYMMRLCPDRPAVQMCSVAGKYGLRRLKPSAPAMISGYGPNDASADGQGWYMTPLDPRAERLHGAHVLPTFCTHPLPPLRISVAADGYRTVELDDNGIGRLSAADIVTGSLVTCGFASNEELQAHRWLSVRTSSPVGVSVIDLLLHRDSFGAVQPKVACYGSMMSEAKQAVTAGPQFSHDEVTALGSANVAASNPDVPRYAELLTYAFARVDWDARDFDVYRFRMSYPILHSVTRIDF